MNDFARTYKTVCFLRPQNREPETIRIPSNLLRWLSAIPGGCYNGKQYFWMRERG